MGTGGSSAGGSKEYARQTLERRLRKRRRASAPDAETEADAASSEYLRAPHSSERDLRDALAHSSGESAAGFVLGLQRAYGNRAVAGLIQRQHSLAPDAVGEKNGSALSGTQPIFGKDSSEQDVSEGTVVGSETADQEAKADLDLATALRKAGDFAGALAYFRRAYSLPEARPDWREAGLFGTAACYQELGQREQAISAWEEYLALPQIKAGRQDLALEHLRELRTGQAFKTKEDIRKPPPPGAQAAADAQALVEINAGHAAGHAEDYQGALAHFMNAYALRYASLPLRLAATTYSGLAHKRLGEFEKALDLCQEALGFPDGAFGTPIGDANPVSRESILLSMRNARSGQTGAAPSHPPISPAEFEAQRERGHELFSRGQYAESLAVLEKLYTATDDPKMRFKVTFNIGQCHQRMGNFDRAASFYLEALGHPGLSGEDIALAEERLRQARMQEVGKHITATAGEADKGAPPGGEQPLFRGEVYFETGQALVNSLGESTISDFAKLIGERHSAEPDLAIAVLIVGHASSRWKSAPDDPSRRQLNQGLSEKRSKAVRDKLRSLAPEPPFIYDPDETGDKQGDKVTSNREDNTWFFRSVTIVAMGGPSDRSTVEVGPS